MPNQPDKPLRLLFVVNVFHPDQLGGAVIFTDLAHALKERGMEVDVRCAYPYYPEWKDKSGLNGFKIRSDNDGDLTLSRYGLFIPRNPKSLIQRLLYEFSFFISLSRRFKEIKNADLIMVFCPLIGAVAFGRLAKFLFGMPIWLNIQDLPAQAAKSGSISSGRSSKIIAWVQKKLFSGYDAWSSISPIMIDTLEEDNFKKRAIHYVPNFLNDSLAKLCADLPSSDKIPNSELKLFYSGNIGTKQNLLAFCKFLSSSNLNFSFRIQGGGSDAQEIADWVAHSNDSRFSFGEFLDEAKFIETLHKSDYCVITEKSGSGGSFIPSKLIPAIASSCPVLAISDADSPLGIEMSTHKIGPHIEWDKLDSHFVDLFQMMGQRASYENWLSHAKERSHFYDRETVSELYYTHLTALYKQTLNN